MTTPREFADWQNLVIQISGLTIKDFPDTHSIYHYLYCVFNDLDTPLYPLKMSQSVFALMSQFVKAVHGTALPEPTLTPQMVESLTQQNLNPYCVLKVTHAVSDQLWQSDMAQATLDQIENFEGDSYACLNETRNTYVFITQHLNVCICPSTFQNLLNVTDSDIVCLAFDFAVKHGRTGWICDFANQEPLILNRADPDQVRSKLQRHMGEADYLHFTLSL